MLSDNLALMQVSPIGHPREIVRASRSRLGLTQKDFAKRLRSRQSLISKYESGAVDPPATLIIHCMNILNADTAPWISEDDLARLVKDELRGDKMGSVRFAVARVIRGMIGSGIRP